MAVGKRGLLTVANMLPNIDELMTFTLVLILL